jgi:phosphoribosylaminoimidazole carboxylase (NCAIR synthetase)
MALEVVRSQQYPPLYFVVRHRLSGYDGQGRRIDREDAQRMTNAVCSKIVEMEPHQLKQWADFVAEYPDDPVSKYMVARIPRQVIE